MTYRYKCDKCNRTSAQPNASTRFCYYCYELVMEKYFQPQHVDAILALIKEGDVVAEIGPLFGNIIMAANKAGINYRYWYLVDAIEHNYQVNRSQHIACNTNCQIDIYEAVNQMAKVDVLILDAHQDSFGMMQDFYSFISLLKVGGKVAMNPLPEKFIEKIAKTRPVKNTNGVIVVDWV